MRRRLSLGALLLASALAQAEPLRVVASFSILGDVVGRVGGDAVAVTTLIGADGAAHAYVPTPADVQRVAAAELLVVNGLGFESWLPRLLDAAGYHGPVVRTDATGFKIRIVDEGGKRVSDPHLWQRVANVAAAARLIGEALAARDPAHAAAYRARAAAYADELRALDAELRARFAAVPTARRRAVVPHDAFGYLGAEYGVRFLAPSGLAGAATPPPRELARLLRHIRATRVAAVFGENTVDPRLPERIARAAGVPLGGTLYADALSPPGGPADSYVALMRHNAAVLVAAMQR